MDYRLAIKNTIAYASYFDFPLFPHEIHHWLVCKQTVPLTKIAKHLPLNLGSSEQKKRQLLFADTLVKVNLANRLVGVLKYIPGLRMIGLTGSVAASNAKPKDDIDLVIITAPHTLWIVRPLVLILISLFFRRRHPEENPAHAADAFCPNLWLDTLSLSVPKSQRNLYTAHEVLQVKPIFNKGQTYERFLRANDWAKQFLANAYRAQAPKAKVASKDSNFFLVILIPMNHFLYWLQFCYMFPKKTSEVVHLHAAFLHTTNFSDKLDRFLEKS
jgi:hypothetical protein